MADTLDDKIKYSCEVLKTASEMSKTYYKKPIVICYSGGKDSDVLVEMAKLALKPGEFCIQNAHTSVDAPETVYYIRQRFDEWRKEGIQCDVILPRDQNGHHITMWNLIEKKKMPPTRLVRYCCAYLKETATPNQIAAVGVREDESAARGGRNDFTIRTDKKAQSTYVDFKHIEEVMREDAFMRERYGTNENELIGDECTYVKAAKENKDLIVSPIYRWKNSDVWAYIRDNNLPYNPLYDKGFYRVGCVGCPMGDYRGQTFDFSKYPQYKKLYIHAFDRMLERHKGTYKGQDWKNGEDVFSWWIKEAAHV